MRDWTDERVEQIMGGLLRAGVALAGAVVLLGGVVFLYRHGGDRPHYRIFRGEPSELRTLAGAVGDLAGFRGRGIILLGLLILIATPIARVIFSVYAFARERDWLYVGVTALVLAILVYSLVWGRL